MKDPVCQILVSPDQNATRYRGLDFAFCSLQCKERFVVNPHLYICVPSEWAKKQAGARIGGGWGEQLCRVFVHYLEETEVASRKRNGILTAMAATTTTAEAGAPRPFCANSGRDFNKPIPRSTHADDAATKPANSRLFRRWQPTGDASIGAGHVHPAGLHLPQRIPGDRAGFGEQYRTVCGVGDAGGGQPTHEVPAGPAADRLWRPRHTTLSERWSVGAAGTAAALRLGYADDRARPVS